jgi:small subunit ribosomal protein S21
LRRKQQTTKRGISVEVRNGDFNGALRRFKKLVQEEGIIQEVRDRQQYTKPSEVKKRAKAAGRARWLKKVRKMEQELGWSVSTKKRR